MRSNSVMAEFFVRDLRRRFKMRSYPLVVCLEQSRFLAALDVGLIVCLIILGSLPALSQVRSDTSSLDLATHRWHKLDPVGDAVPQERCLHSITIDSEHETVYLFGGCSSGVGPCPRGDLWSYDPGEQRWTELTPSGSRPTDRSNSSLAYDTAGRRMVLFGGADQRGTNDAWSFAPLESEWVRLEPTGNFPPVRWSQAAVFDPRKNRLLVFGGTDGALWYDDLRELRF